MKSKLDLGSLPGRPGVYIYTDSKGQIIYVGKAINLKKRVSSYFNRALHDKKTENLVEEIFAVETIMVESELEALILEANLIKKHKPKFNIRLIDDKDYLYIKVTNEEFPRVMTARSKDLAEARAYFGPFPSSTIVKLTLKRLRRVFPWCSSGRGKVKRACFYRHLGLCPGPCSGEIEKGEYMAIIKRFIKFMEGKKDELSEELSLEMGEASKKLDFERASAVKQILSGVAYLTSPNRVSLYLANPNFLEDESKKALEELRLVLKLNKIPERIECFDISNISGKFATGSMVVITDGELDKSMYRRFKIRISGRANDFAMHAEMMRRRLKHSEWGIPDLILIDGGRGQVRAAFGEMIKLDKHIPTFGIAKRFEWLYPVDGEVIKLARRSLALLMVTRIRDESHRFAINYHRKLRGAGFIGVN